MTDESSITISQDAYDALLAQNPWIRSRDPYAYLSRGWETLVVEMLDAMHAVMKGVIADHPDAHVRGWYTKEKFGELRVHFDLRGAPPEVWAALRVPICRAQGLSIRTCGVCGATGRIRDRDGWYATRCDTHA